MATTRHMNLVGRGGIKIFQRQRLSTHTGRHFLILFFGSLVTSSRKGYYVTISRRSGGCCVSISRGSGECEITMQLSCLKSKPNIRSLQQGAHFKSLVGAAGFWVLEKHKKPVHARRQAGDWRGRGCPLGAPRMRPLQLAADLKRSWGFTISRGSWRIFGDVSVTIAQWRRARDLTKLGYPQVPGSIPAKTPSTQINMDLSKYTLK